MESSPAVNNSLPPGDTAQQHSLLLVISVVLDAVGQIADSLALEDEVEDVHYRGLGATPNGCEGEV